MIRKLHPSDIDRVVQIWLDASIKAHDFVDSEFWKSKVTDMKENYLPNSETYVYEEENSIKGFMSLYENTIAAVFVCPDSQGSGIGKQFIKKAKELRNSLILTVYKENTRSIEFYKKCGFKIEQEQTDEHTGHPELVMSFKP